MELTNGTPSFMSTDTGKDIAISFTDFSIPDDAAKNYTLTQPTDITANINKAALTITGAIVADKAYNGNENAEITAVTFDGLQNGETLTLNTDYTVSSAAFNSANVNDANKVTFAVELNDAVTNYTLSDGNGEAAATITKATEANKTLTTTGNRGQTNVYTMPAGSIVTGGTVGAVTTGENSIIDGTPTYDSSTGKLTYKLKSGATEAQTATVMLTVTSDNYNDYTIKVTINVAEKETVSISITPAAAGYVYNGSAQAPTVSVAGNKVNVDELDVTYTSADGTTYPESKKAPTNAGKYIMTVKVPDSNTGYTGFEITRKPLTATITATDKIYDGKTTATVTAKLDGVVASDSGKVTATVTNPAFANKNADTNKKVTAAITLDGTAAGNYTVNATSETKASISVKEVSIVNVTVEGSMTLWILNTFLLPP